MDLSREKYVNGSETKRMLTTETYHREKRKIYYREKMLNRLAHEKVDFRENASENSFRTRQKQQRVRSVTKSQGGHATNPHNTPPAIKP